MPVCRLGFGHRPGEVQGKRVRFHTRFHAHAPDFVHSILLFTFIIIRVKNLNMHRFCNLGMCIKTCIKLYEFSSAVSTLTYSRACVSCACCHVNKNIMNRNYTLVGGELCRQQHLRFNRLSHTARRKR